MFVVLCVIAGSAMLHRLCVTLIIFLWVVCCLYKRMNEWIVVWKLHVCEVSYYNVNENENSVVKLNTTPWIMSYDYYVDFWCVGFINILRIISFVLSTGIREICWLHSSSCSEVYNAICPRLGHTPHIPEDSVQAFFNDMKLYPSKDQGKANSMYKCASVLRSQERFCFPTATVALLKNILFCKHSVVLAKYSIALETSSKAQRLVQLT
jgi:hypothetical protein